MMFFTQSTPNLSVAEHYGLRNTTSLYSKDVASGVGGVIKANTARPCSQYSTL
jgi:hypothetical protein